MEERTISIRVRDSKGDLLSLSLDEVLVRLDRLREDRGVENVLE